MANETLLASKITIGNAISAAISGAFVNKAHLLPLVYTESFPDNTNVIKFRKSGYLDSAIVAENTAYTYSGSSVLTDSSVSCTAEKSVLATKTSVEAVRFGTSAGSLERIAGEQASGHGRQFDTQVKTLFSSVTNAVIAATTLTKNDCLDARYNIAAATKGAFSGQLVGSLHFKGANELRKEMTSITATAWSNSSMLGLLGVPQPGKPSGEVLGIQFYESDGHPTTGGDNIQCVWDPTMAFAAGVDGRNGAYSSIYEPSTANGVLWEIMSWLFFKVVLWNDTAACKLRSDS